MEKGTCVSVLCCANCTTKHHFFGNEAEASRFEMDHRIQQRKGDILSLSVADAVLVDGVIYIKPRHED